MGPGAGLAFHPREPGAPSPDERRAFPTLPIAGCHVPAPDMAFAIASPTRSAAASISRSAR